MHKFRPRLDLGMLEDLQLLPFTIELLSIRIFDTDAIVMPQTPLGIYDVSTSFQCSSITVHDYRITIKQSC